MKNVKQQGKTLGIEKRKFRKNRTNDNIEELKIFDKKYKKILDKNMNLYRKKMSKELRNLKSNNPKEYWQILNRGKKKTQPNIPTESLFEYFKELNSTPSENENSTFSPNIDPYDVNCVTKDLNQKITQKEIIDCIKRLKNNKASGDDRVINEYIKYQTKLMYTKNFLA